MVGVPVKPELLRWARERAGRSVADLQGRFQKLPRWEHGDGGPTLKQLESFAKAVHVPVGYLFLDQPPKERLPLPDFRTVGSQTPRNPSPDLLDTLYLCQQRQTWYQENAKLLRLEPVPFVGRATTDSGIESAANEMRKTLGFSFSDQTRLSRWTEVLRHLIELVDESGVLVMCSGVVGNNTSRVLDVGEFRGFALVDPYAPLIFINGADTKSAQLFTLAHELAHIWLGQSALSDVRPDTKPAQQIERWCNAVAAEFLVPAAALTAQRISADPLTDLNRLVRIFKVSTLVMLRRLWDTGCLDRAGFFAAYQAELQKLREMPKKPGGNFYLTLPSRASKRFTRALVVSAFEGQTSFVEAMRLLGVKKVSALQELGHRVGVQI